MIAKLKTFSPDMKRNFSLNKAKNEKKLFFGRNFGSIPTFTSTRKGKKSFCDERLSDHKVLHNIASSSSFFDFARIFSLFSIVFRTSKFLDFKEFNKTIFPFALVGYETGYSQLGAMRFVGYVYLCISMCSHVEPCTSMCCHVYPCTAMYVLVYPCLSM